MSGNKDQTLLNNPTPSTRAAKNLMTSELSMVCSQHDEELAIDNLRSGNLKLAQEYAENALRKNPYSKNARTVLEEIARRNHPASYPGGYDRQEAEQ